MRTQNATKGGLLHHEERPNLVAVTDERHHNDRPWSGVLGSAKHLFTKTDDGRWEYWRTLSAGPHNRKTYAHRDEGDDVDAAVYDHLREHDLEVAR